MVVAELEYFLRRVYFGMESGGFGYLKREFRELERKEGITEGNMIVYDDTGKRGLILLFEGEKLESIVGQLERFCRPFVNGRFFEVRHRHYRWVRKEIHTFKIRAGIEDNDFRIIDRRGKVCYKTDLNGSYDFENNNL